MFACKAYQSSAGEICVADFISPENGASMEIYLVTKKVFLRQKGWKQADKNGYGYQTCNLFWNGFLLWVDEGSNKNNCYWKFYHVLSLIHS